MTHPAFLAHVESSLADSRRLFLLNTADIPTHLPSLNQVTDIAEFLKISPVVVRNLIARPAKHYRRFRILKRSGDYREITAPRTFMKVVQWWVHDCILQYATTPPCVHGFVKGRSFITNASAHIGARYMLNVDIKDYFPSIRTVQIEPIFRAFGYNERVASGLTSLTTYSGVLPQGAPTSPMLANLATAHIDAQFEVYSNLHGLTYTRYADDFTFSSKSRIPFSLLATIERTLNNSGFALNPRKSKFMGINQRKEVTGLIVTDNAIRLAHDHLNGHRGWFHTVAMQPLEYTTSLDRIRGHLNLLKQVGGPGSRRVIELGEEAVAAVVRVLPSVGSPNNL